MKTIKQLCEEYSINQSELARMYDIPLRTVQDWHAGRRVPPPYVVKMLDELLALKKEMVLVYKRQAQEHVAAEEISAEDLELAEIVKAQGRELLTRTKVYLQKTK